MFHEHCFARTAMAYNGHITNHVRCVLFHRFSILGNPARSSKFLGASISLNLKVTKVRAGTKGIMANFGFRVNSLWIGTLMSDCLLPNAKSRIDKLGLKPGHAYQAWGEFDDEFERELLDRAGVASDFPLDILFVRLGSPDDLPKLLEARAAIKNNGMIWAVWPKGHKQFGENHIRDFALAHGLVDVKVMKFSDLLSGLKLVIPVNLR